MIKNLRDFPWSRSQKCLKNVRDPLIKTGLIKRHLVAVKVPNLQINPQISRLYRL